MTVKELRELLEYAPDDMLVLISAENVLHPGAYCFMTPCPCETGVAEMGEGVRKEDSDMEAFVILRHGFSGNEYQEHKHVCPQAN